MPAASIDTLSSAYDLDIHAAHRAARAQGWYANTPAGLIVLGHEPVRAVLHDRRWRELGAAALQMAGITNAGSIIERRVSACTARSVAV